MDNQQKEAAIRQDFKELNVYLNDIYKQSVSGEKDAGHLWIAFTDKFNAFQKKVLSEWQASHSKQEQGMRWVKCYDSVPTVTKYYIIRNWITCDDVANIYCDSINSIQKYCKMHLFDFSEIEWLDESIK